MRKSAYLIFSLVIVGAALVGSRFYLSSQNKNNYWEDKAVPSETTKPFVENNTMAGGETEVKRNPLLQPPLDRARERVMKKPFGIFVSPQNSPVSPERFLGYHSAIDLEAFPEEIDADVEVKAICPGKLLVKRNASGYGGVAVQSCDLEGSPITVVYGHLKLASISKNIGEELVAGEKLGILGKEYSPETDGERKHLHLGIHKGSGVNLLGYVQNKNELSQWFDPCLYVCN